jgi:hypothetical protein
VYVSLELKATLRMRSFTVYSLNLFFNSCNWKSIAAVNISTLKYCSTVVENSLS